MTGGSITGFSQNMQSEAIPEPATWVMIGLGFAALGFAGRKRITRNWLPI
jgi:hypothetical protein